MLKHITLAALASMAFAQTQDLNATLSGIPELSNLTSYYISLPDSLSALSAARNITILAPSNNAFEQLLSSPLGAALTNDPDLVQAMLTYHVLNGSYSSSQITEDSQFIPTLLTDPRYTNVTGGQRVEVEKEDGNDVFYSGLRQNLTLGRSVCISPSLPPTHERYHPSQLQGIASSIHLDITSGCPSGLSMGQAYMLLSGDRVLH